MLEPLPIEATLRRVEPALRLVPERHLRKVLHYLHDHRRAVPLNLERPLWIARTDLIAADVVSQSVLSGNEDPLLLITTPADRIIDNLPLDEQVREYWRLLNQAAVQAAIDKKLIDGSLTNATCETRLTQFGPTDDRGPAADREIRYVLESEHLVDSEANASAVYRTFAAAYLDLHAFSPEAVADCFPSLGPVEKVLETLGQDLDASLLKSRSRPSGAGDALRTETATTPAPIIPKIAKATETLTARAMVADQKGNFVRAAILRTQIAWSNFGENRELLELGTLSTIGHLVHSLAGVLGWNEESQREWRHAIVPLLEPAAAGIWPRAARCLYELQKIPSDLSREVFAVDLVEPIRTLGRRPIKRPLPHARGVMMLLKLRAAHNQLLRSGLDRTQQKALDHLFHHELRRVEHEIRHKLAPIIATALTESGFHPANRVEEVARDKIVAELLDRVCERGYLRFGDLRDAVARNQLKMPDLDGPVELIAGDSLLRADTRLAYDLDGIYRRGEFYLRALQRGSSLFFGTKWGRWLFLYLIAPFLAAFLVLTFAIELKHIGGKVAAFTTKILAPKQILKPSLEHETAAANGEDLLYFWDEDDRLVWVDPHEYEWDPVTGHLVWVDHDPIYVWDDDDTLISFDPDDFGDLVKQTFTSSAAASKEGKPQESAAAPPAKEGKHHESALPTWEPVFALGLFLMFVFHAPPFRRALFAVLTGLFNALRVVLHDVPSRVLRSRMLVNLRYSLPVRILARYFSAPILLTMIVVFLLWFLGASPGRLLRWGGVVLAAATIAFNTPWGWGLQESLAESLSDGWRNVRVNLLPGLITTILDWFRRLGNWIERQLYEVDEWLRFRGGDSSGSLVGKALIGLFWFPFAYLARFAFYLLIEPQINPVKHFPVVTVSHKVILPLTPNLAEALNVSNATALWLLAGVPGIFGFIAWELLANWRLYAANRPERLKPVVIGSHGESMRGLLRPGFHSGAVPKLFRKLRNARLHGKRSAAVRLHHDLHHAAEGVHRFIERELIALLESCPEADSLRVSKVHVHFGCQQAVVEIAAPEIGADAFVLSFENRDDRIAGAIEQPGWLNQLTAPRREAVLAALRGLFDMAAAEQYKDRERAMDAKPEVEGGLLRPYTWGEWVKRWEGKR